MAACTESGGATPASRTQQPSARRCFPPLGLSLVPPRHGVWKTHAKWTGVSELPRVKVAGLWASSHISYSTQQCQCHGCSSIDPQVPITTDHLGSLAPVGNPRALRTCAGPRSTRQASQAHAQGRARPRTGTTGTKGQSGTGTPTCPQQRSALGSRWPLMPEALLLAREGDGKGLLLLCPSHTGQPEWSPVHASWPCLGCSGQPATR